MPDRRSEPLSDLLGAGLRIACIGDSLSTGFSIRSPLGSVWAARFRRNQGWFNGTEPGLRSLVQHLEVQVAVGAQSLATVSAHTLPVARSLISHRLFGTRHLPQQIDAVLSQEVPPDVVLLWIGHNDLDFMEQGCFDFDPLASRIAEAVLTQAERLRLDENFSNRPRLAVVFGLVDFARFFEARDEVARLRADKPELYPYFKTGYAVFSSMLPAHRAGMIKTALGVNERLRDRLSVTPSGDRPVRLVYSDALFATDLSRAITLSPSDGWHPSVHGHNLLAKSAACALERLLPALTDNSRLHTL